MLRQLFCKMITSNGPDVMGSIGTEIDERDGFGPVRVVAGQSGPLQSGIPEADPFISRTMEICLRFVVNGPLLHSLSGEPTKDTEVIDAVLACDVDNPEGFLIGFPLLLSDIQRGTFSLGGNLDRCLKVLGKILTSYKYQKSERMLQVTCQLLNAILESWLNSAEVREGVEDLLDFLLKRNLRKQARYRSERDAFIRFVEQVVIHQPHSLEWVLEEKLTKEVLLTMLPLGLWNTDNDVRVRFRAAVLNARIFHALQPLDISPSLFYTGLQQYLNQIEIEQ
jgi:ataxia telangiectasia mutated family protein